VPAEAVAAAKESVAAALSVASQAPAELQGSFAHAASSAFVEGMSRGSIVAAGVSLLGAVIAALFLPGRLTAEEVTDLTAMGSFPGLDELAPDLDEVAPDLDELAPEPA
jgi:hypothetical protein